MAIFLLIAFALGGLAGYLSGRWWAAALALLAPVPFYLGIALGLYGNGFGDEWQLVIPLWAIPVLLAFGLGALSSSLWGDRHNANQT